MKTALEYSKELATGTMTSRQLVQYCLDRVHARDGEIHAFLSIDEADVLAQADASDARRAAGKALSPLDGVPVAIKDNIAVNGQPLTCASKMLEKFVSPYDATVIANLRAAGAVIFGRCNMDEFAMGSSTENSAFVKTVNPWNKQCVPGGSSGGSAAAVAARMAPIALGSDTGGSIRQPASFCGVVGFKPTYGSVSRYGAVAFASSLEQVGPLGTSVEDVAMLYDAIASEDTHDSTALPGTREKTFPQLGNFKPCKIGLPKEFFGGDAEIDASVRAAAEWYKNQGCEIKEISLPSIDLAIPTYYIIATAEASSNLARFDGIRYTHRSARATDAVDIYAKSRGEAFGEEVKRRILLGTYVLSAGFYDAYYKRAQQVRTLIRNEFEKAFEEVDLILTPTTPETAFPQGGKIADPLKMYLGDICTVPANLAGVPAVSLPCGLNSQGMPMGMQLLGKALNDGAVLAAAYAYEQANPFATPNL